MAEVPLATLVTVSGAAGGISLSVHSKELHFINHFNFATFTLFSLSGASLVPFLFFQATRNGIEMWEIFSCLINCASEASFRSWITVLSFPAHCQAFPALGTAVSLLSSSLLLSHTLLSPLQFCSLLDYLSSSLFCILRAQSSFPGSKGSQSSSRQAFPALQHRQCGCECPVCLPRKSFSFIHFYIFLLPLGHCDFNDLFPDVFLLKWL